MSRSVCIVSDTIHSYLGSGIESGIGGAERQQLLLARGLRDNGYDVTIATIRDTPSDISPPEAIDVNQIIPDRRGLLFAPYKAIRTVIGLSKIDADVYYVRGNDFLSMVTAVWANLTGRAFVYAVANDENVDPELLKARGLRRYPFIWAMQSADTVIAQTEIQRSLLEENYDITPSVVANGYDVPGKSDLIPHSDRQFVLWVGSIDPCQKKPRRFIDLARSYPETNFVMIGPPDNDNPAHFEVIRAEADSIENLDFKGFVDPDEIHEYFRRAIALVNTSEYEGFPNVFLEAWRYETPVISLYHSLDGLLEEESVGILAGSLEGLVDAVEDITTDVSLRQTFGRKGRRYMIEHYSADQLITRYVELFDSLLNVPKPR